MFTPFMTTGIGSLPHTDPYKACRLVLDTFDIPFWPQLPRLSFREFMIPQFSEGMPFLKVDEKRETIWIERDGDDLTKFYETYSEDMKLTISETHARGLHAFMHTVKDRHFQFLKGHVTGPLTFTLGLKDSRGRLIYFDEELREIALMLLKAKIRWQIDFLKPYAENIILFVDEPILSALGSTSYIGVKPEETKRLLKEVAEAIRHAGGIPGIHCCGNADWPVVITSSVNIISFDAYGYVDTVSIYPSEFTEFLRDGGYLALGIVPTTDSIKDETTDSLKKRFQESIEKLSRLIPEDLLLSRILLTPSCGTGSRSIEDTLKVFRLLRSLKAALS